MFGSGCDGVLCCLLFGFGGWLGCCMVFVGYDVGC